MAICYRHTLSQEQFFRKESMSSAYGHDRDVLAMWLISVDSSLDADSRYQVWNTVGTMSFSCIDEIQRGIDIH
jgi:hypothetical protein